MEAFDPELLLCWLLPCFMSLAAGGAVMVLRGLMIYFRSRGSQTVFECVTWRACVLVAVAGIFTLLLINEAKTVPWDSLGALALLVAMAPSLLAWLGPPEEHVEACDICQIGKGSAYSHFFGYLRLMHGVNGIRNRLEAFKRAGEPGLSEEELRDFYSTALVVLAPTDGEYPSDSFQELKGVGKELCQMERFKCPVGGNRRSYGAFSVHEVTSSSGGGRKYVALDKVGALATLRKLRKNRLADLCSDTDCLRQMKDMMKELEKIVDRNSHLRGQLKVVRYKRGDHVGDAILEAIGSPEPEEAGRD